MLNVDILQGPEEQPHRVSGGPTVPELVLTARPPAQSQPHHQHPSGRFPRPGQTAGSVSIPRTTQQSKLSNEDK